MKVSIFFIGVLLASGLFFTTCSSGGGSSTTTTDSSATVTAVDGYIRGAIVTDSAGQIGVYTSNGQYTFSNSVAYPLFLTGGVLEDTDVPFDINMTAPEDSLVMSPITTFLANDFTLLGKFANLGLGASTLDEFSVDYIDTNNSDLAKLSQLLYLAHKDITLLNAFKTRLISEDPTSLDEMFALLETDINATMSSGYAISYRAFLTAVKALTVSPSEYETELKIFKASLNVDLTPVTYNGVTYGLVLSPYTGNIWLDKNLGASQVCTAKDDSACYGDYYQWGRKPDGHQESNSTTTTTQAADINDAGESYILSTTTDNYDWATDADTNGVLRNANWSKTDGSSVCPVGYRVPTIRELRDETVDSTTTDAFNSFLKLPFAGNHAYDGDYIESEGSGYLWSSTLSSENLSYSDYLFFYGDNVHSKSYYRAMGVSVRCLKHDINLVPTATSFSVSTDENMQADIRLLGNDGDGDSLAYTIYLNPIHGTLSGTAPNLTYNPTTGYTGNDTFTYTVNDGKVNSKTATVSLTIGDVLVMVTHNEITYGTVTSPYTGQIWLDRNLGASQVCTAKNDTACYGNYYQWGRYSDGHQEFNSDITTILAENLNNAGADFILTSSVVNAYYDWILRIDTNGSLRSVNWSKTDGTSVCPGGYRVPTITELLDETLYATPAVSDGATAFENFLKLPSAGYRGSANGNMASQGGSGFIYSSSVSDFKSSHLSFSVVGANTDNFVRSNGYSVRCIKSNIAPTATSFSVSTDENVEVDITLSGNDRDGDSLTYMVVTNPLHGTLSGTAPNLIYSPATDYEGSDSFTYKVNDGIIDSEIATVSVTINDVPVIVVHNGVTYSTVKSPFTEKIWLDRNLGASRVCTALDDIDCYGDYYQWGRNSDGHEKLDSNTTDIQATDINSAGTDFITSSAIYDYDWAQAVDGDGFLRAANWSKTDGTSVCPVGFRVPTITELLDETLNADVVNSVTAFENFLKLPSAGYRDREDASMKVEGDYVMVWSSSVTDVRSDYIYISDSANTYYYYRSSAHSVRCIED